MYPVWMSGACGLMTVFALPAQQAGAGSMPKRSELRITKRTLDALRVEGKDAGFWDRDPAGFGVRVEYFSTAGTSSRNTCITQLLMSVEELEAAADDRDPVPLDEVFHLERRLDHLDAERLGLVVARDDAAVVRRQDNGGVA